MGAGMWYTVGTSLEYGVGYPPGGQSKGKSILGTPAPPATLPG